MLPVLLVTVDSTVLNFALPSIATDLHPSAAVQLWLLDAYPLVLCSLLVAGGSLGDRLGRRSTLMAGTAGFALASIGAGIAPTAELLLAARIATGVFGAVILPATHSLLRSMFEDRGQRRLAIAVWSTGFAAGAAVGPVIGGWLIDGTGWPAVFFLAAPCALVLLLGAPVLIDESRDPHPGPLDLRSVVLSALMLGSIVAAIKRTAATGGDVVVIALAVVGIVAGALFVRRMMSTPDPMLDLRLLRRVEFAGPILVNLVSIASMTGFLFAAAQSLQLIEGLPPSRAAWVLVPGAVANVGAGLAVVRLVRLARPATVLAAGLLSSAAGSVLMAVPAGMSAAAVIGLAYVMIGVGVGAAGTVAGDLMMATIPPDRAGAASAVSETAYELGTVLGVTVFGGILTAAYSSSLTLPEGLTTGQRLDARATLAGAVDTAGTLPSATAEELTRAAAAAFGSGVFASSILSAALVLAAALATLVLLRRASA